MKGEITYCYKGIYKMSYLNTNSMKGGLASGVITLNKKNIIIAVNEQYLVMTGFNQSDLKGLPISKFDKLCAEQISFSKNNSNFGHFNSTLHVWFDVNTFKGKLSIIVQAKLQ